MTPVVGMNLDFSTPHRGARIINGF